MNKNKILGGTLLLLLIILGVYFFVDGKTTPVVEQTPPSFDPKNATYNVDGTNVTLKNGTAETEAAPGSASKISTAYFGNEATGDLTNDGKDDIAFLISQSTGGTGTFYYAVVAIKTDTGHKLTNTFFVGDRIAPQNNRIVAGKLHIIYADRRPGEPMSTPPSSGAVLLLKVIPEGKLLGLMQ